MRRLSTPSALVLSATGLTATLTLLALAAGTRPVAARPVDPLAGSAPAGIKAAGQCTVHSFNQDATQVATIVMDFYKQGGGPPVSLALPPLPPLSDYAVDLGAESKLTNGAYAD